MLLFSRLCDPGLAGLGRYSDCPVDGSHKSFCAYRRKLAEPFLAGAATFFLAVSLAPASAIEGKVPERSWVSEVFSGEGRVVCFQGEIELVAGITANPIVETVDMHPALLIAEGRQQPLVVSGAMSAAAAGYLKADYLNTPGGYGPGPSVFSRLVRLSTNCGMLLLALSPLVGSMVVWNLPPRWRRRVRRHRYIDTGCEGMRRSGEQSVPSIDASNPALAGTCVRGNAFVTDGRRGALTTEKRVLSAKATRSEVCRGQPDFRT